MSTFNKSMVEELKSTADKMLADPDPFFQSLGIWLNCYAYEVEYLDVAPYPSAVLVVARNYEAR